LQLRILATGIYTISSIHDFYSANGFGLVSFLDKGTRKNLPNFILKVEFH